MRALTLATGILAAVSAASASAEGSEGDWLAEHLEVHGYLATRLYGRMPDLDFHDRFQVSSWRTELNLETELQLYEDRDWNISFFSVLRPTYDGTYELNQNIYGKDARGGAFDGLSLGADTANRAKNGRTFEGDGSCLKGEFCLGNGHVGSLFSDELEPAIVIDDVVFFGAVTAPWLPEDEAGKLGGSPTGDTYTDYLDSSFRLEAALERLTAALPPGFPIPPGPLVAAGTAGLNASLAKASLSLATPFNAVSGVLGDRGSLKQAPFDVNRRETNLKFDCLDNAHPWCFVRDAYLQVDWRDTSVRAGRQQIVWSKTDAFRLQDVVNPVDLSYRNIFPELEDRRIPVLALDVIQGFGDVGPLQDVSLEGVWVVDRFRPFQFGQCGEPWAYTLACQGRADASAHQLLNFGLAEVDELHWTFANTEPGARLEFRLPEPSVSLSFSFFYGHQDLPVAKFVNRYSVDNPNTAAMLFLQGQGLGLLIESFCTNDPTCDLDGDGNPDSGLGALGSSPWSTGFDPYDRSAGGELFLANDVLLKAWQQAFSNPALVPLGGCANVTGRELETCADQLLSFGLPWTASQYRIEYPRVLTLGASADYQIPHADTILRTEFAWDIDRAINNTGKPNGVDHSDVFLAAIGLDRPTYFDFLNPERTALLSAQVFIEHVVDHDSGSASVDGMVVDQTQVISTFLHEHYWRNDSWIFRNLLAYDWNAHGLVLEPSLRWVVNQNLTLQIGMNMLFGDSREFHNVRDLCPGGLLEGAGCSLRDPTTWNDGQWQTLNREVQRSAQAPFFARQGFADRFMARRDEVWASAVWQF